MICPWGSKGNDLDYPNIDYNEEREMKRAILASVVLMLGLPSSGAAQGDDEASVREAAHGFKAALVAGDGDLALTFLHPDVLIYEGGHGEDYDAYASGHLAGDIGFLSAVPPVLTSDHVTVQGDMALYTSESTSTGTYRDREINSRGAESLVLLRTDSGWKIRHIHWSSGRG